jgi:hypothetical protein
MGEGRNISNRHGLLLSFGLYVHRSRQRRATDGRLIGKRGRYLDGFDAANDCAATLTCFGQQTQAFRYPREFTGLICTPTLFGAWVRKAWGCRLPTKRGLLQPELRLAEPGSRAEIL